MIKAILFDFGGVYMDSPFAAIGNIALEKNIDPALLKQVVFGSYHLDSDHPWHRLERGEISLEQAREGIIEEGRKHQLDTDIYQLLARFADVERGLRKPLLDKTLEWQQRGLQLALVTNNIREFTGWRKLFPFAVDEVYHTISDSSELGIRKPDPAIYQHTLQQLGIEPRQALFLDDYPSNVEAARALGINGFVVEDDINPAIDWVEQQLAQ
ncbi:MAG TPA: HAD family phosphatase [Pseudomonadales bacterium]